MARELYEADIHSLRVILERCLFILVNDTPDQRQKRVPLELFEDKLTKMEKEKVPPAFWQVHRAIDLIKQLENGAFQPSQYKDGEK